MLSNNISMRYAILLLISSFVLCQHDSAAQVYLQLEKFNTPKSRKFYLGDQLEFRVKAYPDTWRRAELIRFVPEEQIVVFDDVFYKTDEFKDIMLRFPAVKKLGTRTLQASGTWFIFGALASGTVSNYNMGYGEVIIGATAALTGLILRTVFSKKKVRLNKRRRLRVIDTRFSNTDGF